jgi:hypothetical protein
MAKYVVQMKTESADPMWRDVNVVEAAPKAKRRSILRQALDEIAPTREGEYRLLDEASAEVHIAKPETQTAWVIG